MMGVVDDVEMGRIDTLLEVSLMINTVLARLSFSVHSFTSLMDVPILAVAGQPFVDHQVLTESQSSQSTPTGCHASLSSPVLNPRFICYASQALQAFFLDGIIALDRSTTHTQPLSTK